MWTRAEIDKVHAMRYSGLSMSQIADELGKSRNAIAGVFRRERARKSKPKPAAKKRVNAHLHAWSDQNLTETWAEYSARKKAERQKMRETEDA